MTRIRGVPEREAGPSRSLYLGLPSGFWRDRLEEPSSSPGVREIRGVRLMAGVTPGNVVSPVLDGRPWNG